MREFLLFLYINFLIALGITVSKIPSTGTPPQPHSWSTPAYDETSNRIILFGGYFPDSREYLSTLFTFSLTELNWDMIYPESDYEPPGLSAAYTAIHSNGLYVFFGQKYKGLSSDVYRFDLITYRWELANLQGDVMLGRYSYSFTSFSYLNSAYVAIFGGITHYGYDNELFL